LGTTLYQSELQTLDLALVQSKSYFSHFSRGLTQQVSAYIFRELLHGHFEVICGMIPQRLDALLSLSWP